jgi:hypothetical protein
MSVFGNIMSAIFGSKEATGAAATAGSPAAGAPAGKPMTREEVEAIIEKIADEHDEDLNWDESIVDLMKLLKLDSSLTARKQLAQELGYTGALDGLGGNERLAAQAGHGQARGRRRQGAGEPAEEDLRLRARRFG